MRTLGNLAKSIAKQHARQEDSAIVEYVRSLCNSLEERGENLEDYVIIREDGGLTYDEGATIKHGTYWGVKHKDAVKVVVWPEDGPQVTTDQESVESEADMQALSMNDLRGIIVGVISASRIAPGKTTPSSCADVIVDLVGSYVKVAEMKARNNSLLDLERWIMMHNLEADMILDGIQHMVVSNLQVPDQPRMDNSKRIAELQTRRAEQ